MSRKGPGYFWNRTVLEWVVHRINPHPIPPQGLSFSRMRAPFTLSTWCCTGKLWTVKVVTEQKRTKRL